MIRLLTQSPSDFKQFFSFLKTHNPYSRNGLSEYLCKHHYQNLIDSAQSTIFALEQHNRFKGVLALGCPKHRPFALSYALFDTQCTHDDFEALWQYGIRFLKEHNQSQVETEYLHTQTVYKQSLIQLGFKLKDQHFLSSYDLNQALPSWVIDKKADLENSYSFQILTLDQFKSQVPDWKRAWYTLHQETITDIPSKIPVTTLSFEEWKRLVLKQVHPNTLFLFLMIDRTLQGYLIATRGDRVYEIDYTTIRRSYRRFGFSTLLKTHLIQSAQEEGLEQIYTRNHRDNPMWQLNQKFGFKLNNTQEIYLLNLEDIQ